jgi:hypothetical protein
MKTGQIDQSVFVIFFVTDLSSSIRPLITIAIEEIFTSSFGETCYLETTNTEIVREITQPARRDGLL